MLAELFCLKHFKEFSNDKIFNKWIDGKLLAGRNLDYKKIVSFKNKLAIKLLGKDTIQQGRT